RRKRLKPRSVHCRSRGEMKPGTIIRSVWGAKTLFTHADQADLQAEPSFRTPHDAYDNAMAEAWVATFKNELVDGRRFPSFEHVEHEVLAWIGFYNDERLHEALGDLPPAEYEELNNKTDNTPMVAST